jgi:AcrR family transcriptional regulator
VSSDEPDPPRTGPGRRPGVRNESYEQKKTELARRVRAAVVAQRGTPSLHELARATEASIPTLKHYFGDRSGAIAEALRTVEADAREHLQNIARPGRLKLLGSLRKVALDLATAWDRFGVGALFAAGMAAGVADATLGPAYIDGVLEPTVRAVEARLRVHAERGELDLDPDDEPGIRGAALAFISPLLVALLHQYELSGARCRPLDVGAFAENHVVRFVAAYGSK